MLREWLCAEDDGLFFNGLYPYRYQDSYDKVLVDLDYADNLLIFSWTEKNTGKPAI